MFKNASDNLNFIARTASHATKPSRTGRINDIPSWAREPEEYYNSIRDQYRSLADQLAKAQASLTDVNEKLKATTCGSTRNVLPLDIRCCSNKPVIIARWRERLAPTPGALCFTMSLNGYSLPKIFL